MPPTNAEEDPDALVNIFAKPPAVKDSATDTVSPR